MSSPAADPATGGPTVPGPTVPGPTVTMRPSAALVRAAGVVAAVGALVLVTHQVALLVVLAPFVAWCALGVLRRPTVPTPEPTGGLEGHRVQAGEVVDYRVRSTGAGMLVQLDLPRPTRCDLEPAAGSSLSLDQTVVRVRPQRWGRHQLGPDVVALTDDWGMWAGSWQPPSDTVTVAPGRDAPGGGDSIPHPVGLVGIHPSRARGDGSTLAEVRRFQVGDRLRRINWRVTSRTGELHTNATTAERDTEVLVVLDTLADLTTHESDPTGHGTATAGAAGSSLDVTVLAAATVAEHYLRLGDRVGLHDWGHVVGSVRPGSGARQRSVITEQLARASVERTARPSLRRIRRVRPGSLVICCSPLLDPDVLAEVLRLVHRGAAVLAVDTLPLALGRLETTRGHGPGAALDRVRERFGPQRFWAEAWALRRLERDVELARLAGLGVPVVAWQGMGSLAEVVAALAASRTAPRLSPGAAGGGR